MTPPLFLQQVLNGLLAASYYLLIALGLSLIFSLGGIVNLAHGAFYRHRRLPRRSSFADASGLRRLRSWSRR